MSLPLILNEAFTHVPSKTVPEAAELLAIPEDVTQAALLPVAWTRGTDFRPAQRPPPESILHWDGWAG